MLKMFTTQLTGLFKRISDKEEMAIEDGARLLAQGALGEGTIYIHGVGEMQGVALEALHGAEPFEPEVKLLISEAVMAAAGPADRVILISRDANEPSAIEAAKKLSDMNTPFIAITGYQSAQEPNIASMADVHIDLQLVKGLIPDETGNRIGLPYSMAALFAYYGLKFTLAEILQEYNAE
ncbi:DUF2529 domain-containing protein [Bacillus sp. M6-12]|uniref:DUF2529 family protein n=1 Tax=Bacillus sp. M6-12 TaxID=2054166 RepID=UPI000C762637|nr:DUF2529 family protein [Bacillus sp. M6-12]PLS18362.1 DUF2529 domain-containing protein [Bacillus sp. M6-12]